MSSEFRTPEWVKDAVFYQIFPDRFAKSDRVEKPTNLEPWGTSPTIYGFKGGDLLGVAEHLDYLQDLGVNAIYFNPIFQSTASHRYHTHDYFRVDPILGGDAAFERLLAEAHRRGIRILLDGVFNHASRGFFQFNHILESGADSPYLDWFIIHDWPLHPYGGGEPNYACWFNLPALPKFNIQNPQVRQFILTVARHWLERGIDGWRLDVPYEIDDASFWQKFRQVAKSVNPEAYILGEIPWEAQRWLQGDQFDAVMNYQFTQACLGFFAGERISWEVEKNLMGLPQTRVLDAPAFARRAEALLKLYPQQVVYAQLNLLSSHDMPRFLTLAGGDKDDLRLATLFQMTYPGAPCIYYGDEIGLLGGRSGYPEGARGAFPWDDRSWDQDLRAFFKACITLRRRFPALRRGDFVTLQAQGGVLAYLRRLGEENLIVAFNNGLDKINAQIPVEAHLPSTVHFNTVFGEGQVRIVEGRLTVFNLPPRSAIVLQAL